MLAELTADGGGLSFGCAPADDDRVVDLLLDDRRIWSFRVRDAIGDGPGRRRMAWPDVLRPYLTGVAVLTLRPVDGGEPAAVRAQFGDGTGPVRFVDAAGRALMVNKWGRAGHALADYDPGMTGRMLDHVDQVRTAITAATGLEVYVTSGTLLGPYRDGRLIPSDDDADLAYLSRHDHPAEVIRENYDLARHLTAAGLTVLRLSAGHLQVHFDTDGTPDVYVDVFTGWIDGDGWWYQLFALRYRARREQLLPVSTIVIEGRPEPAPREPEVMLEGIYGPDWRIPNPAFAFDVPPAAARRLWGWCADLDMDRTPWEERHEQRAPADPAEPAPSPYARWLAGHLAPGAPVVELGVGRAADALWLAGEGHPVDGLDYVRGPVGRARELAAARGLPARFRTLNLYDVRRVLACGAELAARREPRTVYARDLLPVLWDEGRPPLYRLLSMLLRTGGEAHLDVPVADVVPVPGGPPLYRAVPVDRLAAEMAPFGLHVDERHEVCEPVEDPAGGPGECMIDKTRMVVTWRRRIS